MAKEPSVPLPKSLVAALPSSAEVMKHVDAIVKLLPKLQSEMTRAEKRGAVDLARAYVVLHRLREVLCSDEKNWFRGYQTTFSDYSNKLCPQVFEQEGVPHVAISEGYRIGVSTTLRASTVADRKQAAMSWMKDNYPDVVSETINASTLSALARELREDKNVELPAELFKVVDIPTTSVTRI